MNSTINPGSSEPRRRRVAIVIVSWNVRDYLEGCLRSLSEAGIPAWASVIVVDNDSPDATAEMVEREFPFVRLIKSGQNLGFTRGNNLALRDVDADYVWLLNPDTLVPAGTLEHLVGVMDRDSGIGVTAPRQVGGDGRVQYEAAVQLPRLWNTFCDLALLSRMFPKSRLFSGRLMGWWDHLDDRDVPGVAGSAMLIRTEALRQVGLLDEAMFCAEDMDLCRRIAAAGWRIRYIGSAAMTHFGGASIKRANQERQRQIAYQSFWVYVRKHDGRVAAAATAAMVWAVSAGGWCLTSLLRVLPGMSADIQAACDRYRSLARALMSWALADKTRFEHPLAVPLSSAAVRTPALAKEGTVR